jgi:4-hydroxyacetophenone monooxygenase
LTTTRNAEIDAGRLREAIGSANIPILVALLYQLTGDRRWLAEPYAPARAKGMEDNDSGGLPEDVRGEIRRAAVRAILDWTEGQPIAVPAPREEELLELLGVCMGEPVPQVYEPMMAETLGFATVPTPVPEAPVPAEFSVLVIGAGIAGLLAAATLREMGIEHLVLEKNADVGGTWLENDYPGAGVDTPSYLYSYSFRSRPWSTHFGKRDEVHRYLREFADAYRLHSSIRYGVEVESATWDPAAQRWTVTAVGRDGRRQRHSAAVLISATGQLNRPKVPEVPGIDGFSGPIFHSARWPEDLDVTGKRVAVIGTGASAMQVVPAIADRVAALTVFQRSPHWVAPNENYFREIGEDKHWLHANVPFYQAWYRARLAWTFNDKVHPSLQVDPDWEHPRRSVNAVNDAHRRLFTRYLESELDGREDLQGKALPDYPPFGKRMLLDNGWFAALRKDNVELVAEAVEEITADGVRGESGAYREVDVVVLATGFQAHNLLSPIEVVGGSGAGLRDVWGTDDPSAYLGITVPGFPNFFLFTGPNTVLGHGGSQITIIECQMRYMADLLSQMVDRRIGAVEVRPEVAEAYTERVDEAHSRMIWTHPGMRNWYRNGKGRVVATLPWRIVDYRDATLRADLADYHATPRRSTLR